MKARPILMSAPMVRALLAGTKTQTRRIVKPAPLGVWNMRSNRTHTFVGIINGKKGATEHPVDHCWTCPYGEPGDLLWVRENFQPTFQQGEDELSVDWQTGRGYKIRFSATEDRVEYFEVDHGITSRCKPGIFMPRWASRLTLRISEVRVERLQEISREDAIAEGCYFTDYGLRCHHVGQGDPATCPAPSQHHSQKNGWMWDKTTSDSQCLGSPQSAFGNLWIHVNGQDSWDSNPWIWALNFEVLQKNVDEVLANG